MHNCGDRLWVLVLYHHYTFRLILTNICGHLTSCHVPTLVELMFCWRRQENKQINFTGGEWDRRSTGRKERVGGGYSSTRNAGQVTQCSIRDMGSSDLILKPSCVTVFRGWIQLPNEGLFLLYMCLIISVNWCVIISTESLYFIELF